MFDKKTEGVFELFQSPFVSICVLSLLKKYSEIWYCLKKDKKIHYNFIHLLNIKSQGHLHILLSLHFKFVMPPTQITFKKIGLGQYLVDDV